MQEQTSCCVRLRVGQRAGIPQIEIEDDVILCRHFRQARAHCAATASCERSIVGMGGEDMDALSILQVFRRDAAVSIDRHGAKVGERLRRR